MSRTAHALAALALAALLLGGALAVAAPPAPSGAAVAQIGQAGSSAHADTNADQLSSHARAKRDAAGVAQLGSQPGQTAAAQLTHPEAGRNTHVGPIVGHDRCDPASAEANAAECARIPENRPDDFRSDQPTDATPDTVDPNAPSQDLVNGILSGGTGTVVQLPPK